MSFSLLLGPLANTLADSFHFSFSADPYAEIARMRQSLAALEAHLSRNGISPHTQPSHNSVRNNNLEEANGHTSSLISPASTNDGLAPVESINSVAPAIEVGMYVGPTSAASPLLSFRVRHLARRQVAC